MACENEAFRICSNVSEALSYMPCPLQYTEPNTQNELWIFWSQYNNEFPTVFPITAATTIYHDTIKEKIASALKNAYISDNFGCWLVQFWAPVTSKDHIFLTTCDLPFGLTKLHEGLCFYRSECLKVRIPIVTDSSENEYRLGPTGRVFKHGLPEMSPDVSRYSVADFPQHGSALTAGLGNYLAVPVFEPLSNECAGVLEIIGDKKGSFSQDLVQMVYEMLNKTGFRSSNMYDQPDKKGLRGLERALKEIEEQLNFICRTHQLPLAQTWLPILDRSNVERFTTAEEQFCICTSAGYEFRAACDMVHLGKSQGVVGRAFLSRSSCFCSDITELRMSEYPLAHVAHRVGLRSSFAICLQSSYTGDCVYILEFFLPQDNKSDCRSPQTMLNMLLISMRRQFRSFKLASGQKLGEELSVEVIPVPSDDGLESFEMCHSGKPISDIEAVARPEKILWFNPLNRLLKSGNTVNLCPENVDLTTSSRTTNTTTNLTNNVRLQTNRAVEEESMMKISERQYRINSTVLQQSVGAKVYGSETTLASQSARNNLGTEHLEVNDMSCSSDQLEYAKGADIYFKETSGGDQFCHVATTFLTHAARPNTQAAGVHKESTIPRKRSDFVNSCFPADELERSAKVPKLSEYEEQQIISKEGGSLLKDNFEGGATWAFEVGSKSMVCPIIVEDLNRPRQMRVEMLCEEPVLFVEIANIIIGIGLTILQWVMETRNDKTWATFVVEANRDVTRIEILYSLVRLLEHIAKVEENLQMSLSMT
ncbi:protein NLP7 isoform X2 [Nicotiana tabacum]|uniref:Protein NLP7 isoform X2 n=1 Tax=Nicotiana tabacum TaxID=4097 RepID=A0AC58RZY7_TOBAC